MKVAVILGNRMKNDQSLSKTMIKRLELGLKMNLELNPDKIIVSGGIANKRAKVAEAVKMQEYLVTHGVNPAKIIVEDRSLTTAQNAEYSVPLVLKAGANTMILCSTKEHIQRWFLNPVKIFQKHLIGTDVELVVFSDGHLSKSVKTDLEA